MKTLRFNDSSQAPALIHGTMDTPHPKSGELLIRVHAAGLTPTELLWYPTTHTKSGEKRTGAIPGHELSGVVAALGEGVTGTSVGDEIFGMNDWFAEGATADYCLTRPEWSLCGSWTLKPGGRVVTIAATSEGTKDERIEKAFFIVEPDRNQLIEIGKLVETGDLQLFVAAVIPFDQASAAYTGKLRQTKGRGKLVLEFAGASPG